MKPGNIMWDPEAGRAVLIDLGFAVAGASTDSSETTAGTVHYIAPEQPRAPAASTPGPTSTPWGRPSNHLVTGSLPFSGASGEEVLARQVREALSGERIRRLGLSPQTHYFIEKMMAKDRDHRFSDAAELAAALAIERRRREEAELAARPRNAGGGSRTRGGGSRRRRLF